MGILGAVTVPNITAYVDKSKRAVAEETALKIHNAAHMVKALEKVELETKGVNGDISPQGIPNEVKLVPESSRYSEEYTNLLKSYINLSDKHLENTKLHGPGSSRSQAIRVYYEFNNGNHRIYHW